MPAITKNSYSKEQHPWNWCISKGATKLLIGTFPTDIRNTKHDFFYCSSTNRFWEVLSAVQGYPIELDSYSKSLSKSATPFQKFV